MANEIFYSALTNPVLAATMAQEAGLLLADREVMINHPAILYAGSQGGMGSTTKKHPLLGLDGYNRMAAVAEGSGPSNTALSDAAPSITIARQALQYEMSDLVRAIDATGALNVPRFVRSMLMSYWMRLQEMLAALMGGFSNVVGSTGVNMDVDDWLAAEAVLTLNSVPGPYLAVLHPQQYNDFKDSLVAIGGVLQWSPATREQIEMKGPGYKGNFNGVDIFTSSLVPTANAGADRAGGMFGAGAVHYADAPIPPVGAGVPQVSLGPVLVSLSYSAGPGQVGIVGAALAGVGEREDLRGAAIVTDA